MKRIILHIGAPKTGSSAIQMYFRDNEEHYRSRNIGYYIPLINYDPWSGSANAHFLCAEAIKQLGEPPNEHTRVWLDKNRSLDQFRLELNDKKTAALDEEKRSFTQFVKQLDTVILSDEILWHYEIYYPEFWDVIRTYLLDCTDGDDAAIDVVLYLRRQDRWMLSKWKEDMTNAIPYPYDFDETLAEYEKIGYLDYLSCLKRLEAAFGAGHIIVRSAERTEAVNGSVVSDFIECCNLGADDSPEVDGFSNINYSITTASAYALCFLNKCGYRHKIYDYYRAAVQIKKFVSKSTVRNQTQTRTEREELIDRYRSGNEEISERYMGGRPLFDYEFGDEPCMKPNKVRDTLNAIGMMCLGFVLRAKDKMREG